MVLTYAFQYCTRIQFALPALIDMLSEKILSIKAFPPRTEYPKVLLQLMHCASDFIKYGRVSILVFTIDEWDIKLSYTDTAPAAGSVVGVAGVCSATLLASCTSPHSGVAAGTGAPIFFGTA